MYWYPKIACLGYEFPLRIVSAQKLVFCLLKIKDSLYWNHSKQKFRTFIRHYIKMEIINFTFFFQIHKPHFILVMFATVITTILAISNNICLNTSVNLEVSLQLWWLKLVLILTWPMFYNLQWRIELIVEINQPLTNINTNASIVIGALNILEITNNIWPVIWEIQNLIQILQQGK